MRTQTGEASGHPGRSAMFLRRYNYCCKCCNSQVAHCAPARTFSLAVEVFLRGFCLSAQSGSLYHTVVFVLLFFSVMVVVFKSDHGARPWLKLLKATV